LVLWVTEFRALLIYYSRFTTTLTCRVNTIYAIHACLYSAESDSALTTVSSVTFTSIVLFGYQTQSLSRLHLRRGATSFWDKKPAYAPEQLF